jgi:hypothetical protein
MPPKPRPRPTWDAEEAPDVPAKQYNFIPSEKSYDTLQL